MADEIQFSVWRQIRGALLPGAVEQEPGFRAELERLSRISLLVIGGVQAGLAIFMIVARFFVPTESSTLPFRLKQGAAVIGLGVLTAVCSRVPWAKWWRPLAALSGLLTACVLIFASLMTAERTSSADDFIPAQITLVMLVAVTVIPLKPMHTLVLGACIGIAYGILASVVDAQFGLTGEPDPNYILFIVLLTLLCTAITAIVYRQRTANFELRQTQARMLLAENATSVARLAAALSHELNNPMGALLSGIDTLLLLTSKQATCTPQEQPRLVLLQADVRKSIQQSAHRLKALVNRMQRFTNLDKAEVQSANMNELLTDVAALVEPQLPPNAELKLDLEPLPPVVCRPQQISAVFSNLLSNAVRAVNGTDGGQVVLASRPRPRQVEIEVRDNGHGVDSANPDDIFEPSFKAAGKRVRSANWSMFNARQVIREHGGEIRILSDKGKGTTVQVILPVAEEPLT